VKLASLFIYRILTPTMMDISDDDPVVWRRIPTYPKYEASSKGEIRRIGAPINLTVYQDEPEDYWRVTIRHNKQSIPREVHILVADAFLPPATDSKCTIDHCDTNKSNNTPFNLQRISASEQQRRVWKNRSRTNRKNEVAVDLPGEEWRTVIIDNVKTGSRSFLYEYAVSSFGRVKTVKSNKLFNMTAPTRGYNRIRLFKKNYYVHRLVASAFIGAPPFSKAIVDHHAKPKTNNRVDNLFYRTQAENIQRAVGQRVAQVEPSGKLINVFDSQNEAAKSVQGVHSAIGRAIKSGKLYKGFAWKSVPLALMRRLA
jgi:hypothetical protein